MLWKFKYNKTAAVTVKKNCRIYDQNIITYCQVRNWFHSGDTSLKDELRAERSSDLDQDALRELVECSSSQST